MRFSVVLDTCVVYPAHLRDTLLRLAERELYRPLWSADIIDELRRNLVDVALDPPSVERMLDLMQIAFPDSEVTGYEPLIEAMSCHPKDRHVLAAAVRADASAVVTFNMSDFPPESVDHLAVEVIHPDDFLVDLLDLAPQDVIRELRAQARANRRDPTTVEALLDALEKAGAPNFADEIRRRME